MVAAEFEQMYPFQRHYARCRGFRLHYLDEGSGEPVVMLHGNPTWSFYYRRLVLALRDRYRAIVPDHIGCGLSDKPGDAAYNYTLENRVQDIESLIDYLGINRPINFVLHDWGGMIGMAYAARHPERVRRLIILNTAAFHLPEGKTFPRILAFARTRFGAYLIRRFNAFCLGAAHFCCTANPMPRNVRQAYCMPYDSWDNRIAVLRFVQDIPLRSSDAAYSVVSETEAALDRFGEIPMCICWGMKDFIFDRAFLHEWLRRFPKAEVHRFERAGHYVLEDASDEVVPLIRDFLSYG